MLLKGKALKLSSLFLMGLTLHGCAFARISESDQMQLVEKDVPKIIKDLAYNQNKETFVGDVVTKNAKNLISAGWHGEDVSGDIDWKTYDEKYSKREYMFEVPKDRLHKEESDWDFSTFSMFDRWINWKTLFWESFLGSKDEFDKIAKGHYFRIIAPGADRVYDIIVIRPINPLNNLIATNEGKHVDDFWSAIKPVKEDEFPSIFGPVRFVDPATSRRFNIAQYNVLNVYDKRYFAFGTTPIFHSQFGRSRGRDCYILAFISKKEFVVIQSILYKETTLSTLTDDLKKILEQ